MRILLLLVVLLLATTPLHAGHPSPESWRDITVYQLMTDRFFNGDPSNDDLGGTYDPSDGWSAHGGDWQGLVEKLDYIDGLGVSAIWIGPVVLNANGEYHGYAAFDLFQYSDQQGGLAALQSFVQEAHARGIYVIIDVVANHLGNLIDSADPGYPDYDPTGSYTLRWFQGGREYPAPFDDLGMFHSYGHIQNWTDPDQILGELFGLDDLRTEDPAIRDILVDAYSQLIAATDCDGFRIDTVKHTELEFWEDFAPRIRLAAAAEGKDNFFLMGEVFDGNPEKVGSYTGTVGGGPFKLDSCTWFPMTDVARWVFAGGGVPAVFNWVMADSSFYDPSSRWVLGNFLDNHDIGRLSAIGLGNQDDALLRQGLVWLLTWPGLPIVYYGTEQEFDGGGDPWNREDMWDGEWDFGPSEGDSFDQGSLQYRLLRRLTALRDEWPALRRGGLRVLAADDAGPGPLAYLREHPGGAAGDVLVVLNSSTETRSTGNLSTNWSGGQILVDALAPGQTALVGGGGNLSLTLGGRDARVYLPAMPEDRLTADATWPHHDGTLSLSTRHPWIHFDRPMNPSSGTVVVDPPLAHHAWWRDAQTLVITAQNGWAPGVVYTITLPATTAALDGSTLGESFAFRFHVDFAATQLSLEPGLEAESYDPFGLQHPLGLEILPALEDPRQPAVVQPLAGDVRRDRVLRVGPAQRVSTFAVDPTFYSPLCIDRDPAGYFGGILVMNTDVYVYSVGPEGAVGRLPDPPAWVASTHVGRETHAGWLYAASPGGDTLYRWDTVFWDSFGPPMQNPHGMDQPPAGSGLPDRLYVCDSDLTGGGGGELYRVASDGSWDVWLSGSLVDGLMSLAFAPVGPWGQGNLYATDVLNESIVRIEPDGTLTTVAGGFANLYGSDALEFGPEGDLWVLDPGNSEGYTDPGTSTGPRVLRLVADGVTASPPAPLRTGELRAIPNPFNPSTELRYRLPRAGHVSLRVYDSAGRWVSTLVDAERPEGESVHVWRGVDARGHSLSSGVYHVRLLGPGVEETEKLVLVR